MAIQLLTAVFNILFNALLIYWLIKGLSYAVRGISGAISTMMPTVKVVDYLPGMVKVEVSKPRGVPLCADRSCTVCYDHETVLVPLLSLYMMPGLFAAAGLGDNDKETRFGGSSLLLGDYRINAKSSSRVLVNEVAGGVNLVTLAEPRWWAWLTECDESCTFCYKHKPLMMVSAAAGGAGEKKKKKNKARERETARA
jgi:hypothetical protein